MKICRILIGIDECFQSLNIYDIPTTFSDNTLYQGIRQLAAYIGMSQHDYENLIAWRPKPLDDREKEVFTRLIHLCANQFYKQSLTEEEDKRQWERVENLWFWEIPSSRMDKATDTEKIRERAFWQFYETNSFLFHCFDVVPSNLYHDPIKLPSGKYEEEPKREKTQGEMITEMEQELNSLTNHTAYVKTATGKGKMMQAVPDDALLGEPRVDVRAIAWRTALYRGILRQRSDIEAEIRERQEQWKRPPGNEPPPTDTGGNSPPSLPPGQSGEDHEPPPTIYKPSTPPEENPPGGKSTSRPQGRIVDFTSYQQKRRQEQTTSLQTSQDLIMPLLESAIPISEPLEEIELDTAAGKQESSCALHNFRVRLNPWLPMI
jgi:hypothetical protein